MRNVASGFVVESIGVNVVALARMLLGEGAQHHQSLFTSRIAVPIYWDLAVLHPTALTGSPGAGLG